MLVLVDIDGTIARRNLPFFCRLCNRQFKLNVPETRINNLQSYQEWLVQPELVKLRKRLGETHFRAALDKIGLGPAHLEALLPIDGATDGVKQLAEHFDKLHYCTARKCLSSQAAQPELFNHRIEQATYRWLREQTFPHAHQVIFCSSPREKLYYIVEQIAHGETQVILIDDHYQHIIDAAQTLSHTMQALLLGSCTLIAFRAAEVTNDAVPFQQMFALQAWDALKTVLDQIPLVSLTIK